MNLELPNWNCLADVNWETVEKNLYLLGRDTLRAFSAKHPEEKVVAVVFGIGQNWQFETDG